MTTFLKGGQNGILRILGGQWVGDTSPSMLGNEARMTTFHKGRQKRKMGL